MSGTSAPVPARPRSDRLGAPLKGDVIELRDGSWLFAVADVTGHGVSAAMSAAMVKTLLLQAAEHHARLDKLLRFVNQRFCAVSLTEDFATILVCIFWWEEGWCENLSELAKRYTGIWFR